MNHLKIGGIAIVSILLVSVFISLFFFQSTGMGAAQLTSTQTQFYWKCFADNKCGELLKIKANIAYRNCSLECVNQALKPVNYFCNDIDETNFTHKGTVYSNLYPQGKGDYCYTFSNGKTYIMEGICKDNKYAYVQKGCGEMGNYRCEEGKCVEEKLFNVIILFDENSYNATNQEIKKFFYETSNLLYERTLVRINVLKVISINISNKESTDSTVYNILSLNKDLVKKANSLILFTRFSDCTGVGGEGGCAWSIAPSMSDIGINNYCNTYSNYEGKTNFLYGVVLDWDHLYGKCGYDANEEHISYVSLGGECKNQLNTSCVYKNGYYMCNNVLSDFYASEQNLFLKGTIIHEIMHHYGWHADGYNDHNVGSEGCLNVYKGTLPLLNCNGYDVSECYFNICQYTYENFVNAKNICE